MLLKIVSKNWHFILFLPAIAALIATSVTYQQPNIYAAKTQILLKSDDVYDYQNQIYSKLGYYGVYGDITNQKRIILSHDLISETLSKLNFGVSYFIVGRFRTIEQYDAVPFYVEAKYVNRGLYEMPIKLNIIDPTSYKLSFELNDKLYEEELKFGEEVVIDGSFIINVKKNPNLNDETIQKAWRTDYQFVMHRESTLVSRYKSSLSIENIEYTTILELICRMPLDNAPRFFSIPFRKFISITPCARRLM